MESIAPLISATRLQDGYVYFKDKNNSWFDKKEINKRSFFSIPARRNTPIYFKYKSTEFFLENILLNGRTRTHLVIIGSNEKMDWLWNCLPVVTWKGIKLAGLVSAERIIKVLSKTGNLNPLFISTHSKSGPAGWGVNKLYDKEIVYTNAFAPARGVGIKQKPYKLSNATIFVDPDDIVDKVGRAFKHPVCEVISDIDDHKGIYLKDHLIDHWVKFVKKLITKEGRG